MADLKKIVIWIISDQRRGHFNQSIALGNAISKLRKVDQYVLNVDITARSYILFAKSFYTEGFKLPRPDLIIATGHKTHITALYSRLIFGGRIIVIMRPSLMACLFDLILLPNHDRLKNGRNVISFEGALSRISPSLNNKISQCIIILGGPSRHYKFNIDNLIVALRNIRKKCGETKFVVTNSPRTPKDSTDQIRLHFENTFIPWQSFEDGAVQIEMKRSSQIWVTEDSSSMVYDALSAGAPVGILEVPRRGDSKLSRSVDRIIERGFATTYYEWQNTNCLKPSPLLNEAKRCALQVLKTFFY